MNSTTSVNKKPLETLEHKLHKYENTFMEPEIIVQSFKSLQASEQTLSMNNKTLVI